MADSNDKARLLDLNSREDIYKKIRELAQLLRMEIEQGENIPPDFKLAFIEGMESKESLNTKKIN